MADLFTCKLIHAWFPNTLGAGDGNIELITNIFICSCVFGIVHPGSKRVGSNNKHQCLHGSVGMLTWFCSRLTQTPQEHTYMCFCS